MDTKTLKVLLGMLATTDSRLSRLIRPVPHKKQRHKVVIDKVLSITAGGYHVWIQTNVGKIRKPINSIPRKMMEKFREQSELVLP